MHVACFSEIPLSQLHLVCRDIPGRRVQLEEYGLVFKKKLLIDAGAQPAIYLNSYGSNEKLRKAADYLFEEVKKDENNPLWRFIPYLNAMHENYDFSWEREWRLRKHFKFKVSDIVAVILPSEGEKKLNSAMADAGVACISPSWRYEQIIDELSKQQRTTRQLKLDKRVSAKLSKSRKTS